MRNTSSIVAALIFIVFPCLSITKGLAESEVMLLQDEFDTAALLVEHFALDSPKNWKVEDGFLVAERGATAKANANLDADAKVVADIALIPDSSEAGGFAGISIGGCLFALRQDGIWCVYREKGEKRARGSFAKRAIEPGKSYRVEVMRRSIGGGFAYSWEIDGELMPEFTQMNLDDREDPGELSLRTWKAGARYDAVAAYRLEAGIVSNNTLRNSSFEFTQDGLPLYWMPGVNVDDLVATYGNHENYWKTVQIDTSVFHSEKQSLRVEVNKEVPLNGFKSFDADINKGVPFTYSVWLKSDRENLPANLLLHEKWGKLHTKNIVLGKEWAKYSFTLPKADKGQIWAGLRFNTPGTIWADTAQLESGDVTGDYQASAADARIGKREEEKTVKYHAIPQGSPSPAESHDGKWPGALVLEDFRIVDSDELPKQKTSVQILSDKENLHVRFSCFEKDMTALRSEDEDTLGKISSGDCVELFLDVTGEKNSFYHLFVNPDGGKLSIDQQKKLGWNPDWKVQTSKRADRWDVDIKIPFSSLDGAKIKWGINFARHEPRANDNSCTARVGPKFFSDVARYDQFTFPARALLNSSGTSVVKSIKEKRIYTDRNYYMNEPEVILIASDIAEDGEATVRLLAGDKKVIWSGKATVKKGKNRIPIPLDGVAPGTYQAELLSGKDGRGRVSLVKREFRADGVQIDQDRLCFLVNGEPYFVYAPFFVVTTSQDIDQATKNAESTIAYLANAGMKTISILFELREGIEENAAFVQRVLDYSEQKGVKVLLWIKETPRLMPVAERVREHPAILAWKLWDEPELYAKEEDVARSNEAFQKTIPYRPLVMNNTVVGIPSRYAGLNADVISHDDYITNKPDRKVGEILTNLSNLEEASRELRKPALVFLSGANFQNHYRESSAGELVAQTYGAIIKGMAGTWYFFGIPVGKEIWAAYKRTNDELSSLTNAIFSTEEVPSISSDQTAVLATTRRHEGKLYLITTNTEDRPVTASFQLPESLNGKEGIVLFEDRKLSTKSGQLQDHYEPYSRHIYVFDVSE